jgi:polysaccharide export outer membrane protein
MTTAFRTAGCFLAASLVATGTLFAQQAANASAKDAGSPAAPQAIQLPAAGLVPPDDYVIGPDDVLTIIFWRDKDMSNDVVVRPDGKITLPLINDLTAAGLTPDQLRQRVQTESARYIEDPTPSVVVKSINSRKVFITGEVEKPGPYPLTSPTTVLQLIAMSGGLKEFAHPKDIVIMRTEGGKHVTFPFDYAAVAKRAKLQENIFLKPGDTVLVP